MHHLISVSLCASALLAAHLVSAACPNFCSGHGRCVGVSKCSCYSSWTGGDCSLRKCPTGRAWADPASGVDTAHAVTECSSRGICNTRTGTCVCQPGFEGPACQRMTCASQCSGRGTCVSMRDYAGSMDKGLQVAPYYSYTNIWDADMIYGCSCDATTEGYNCQQSVCPTGDDPMTTGQVDEVQLLRCDLNPTTYTQPLFTLSFRNAASAPFSAATSAYALQQLLQAMPTVGAVSVSYSRGVTLCNSDFSAVVGAPASGNLVAITFTTSHGALPRLLVLDANGGQLSGVFSGAMSTAAGGVSLPYSTATGVALTPSVIGTKENTPCANRGTCDSSTGACTCFPGFGSSNGRGGVGNSGDCGYPLFPVTSCPGTPECSGRGSCSGDPSYTCTCNAGYTGGDCSQRTCPLGTAWFSYPTAQDNAHGKMECSNKGLCDRSTGLCQCEYLFEGVACERMTCPGTIGGFGDKLIPCSGHGKCLTMAQLATVASNNGDPTPYTYGLNQNSPATWDAQSMVGCFCDVGYTGYDCSQRTCPFGNDITLAEASSSIFNEVQSLVCTLVSSVGAPTFRLTFRGATTGAIAYSASASVITQALQSIGTLGTISVTFTAPATQACSSGAGTTIRFTFQTEHGDVPPISVTMDPTTVLADGTYGGGIGWNSGQLVFTGGDVTTAYTTSLVYVKTGVSGFPATGMRTLEVTKGTTGNTECSSRGLCNRSTGECVCFRGFGSSDGMGRAGGIGDCAFREPFQWGRIPQSWEQADMAGDLPAPQMPPLTQQQQTFLRARPRNDFAPAPVADDAAALGFTQLQLRQERERLHRMWGQ